MELVRLADEKDARERRMQQQVRKSESEGSDMRFMLGQYSEKVREEQKKGEEERARVEEAFARIGLFGGGGAGTGKPLIHGTGTANSKKNKETKLFQRIQKIDIETGLGKNNVKIF